VLRHNTTNDGVVALIVPGIGNSGPGHWQTLWEERHPGWQRVQQRDWDRPVCAEWLRGLDAAMARLSAPPVLIAHSMGCLLVAHWAKRSSLPVRAAFLVAVPDPAGPMFPPAAQGFQPVPSEKLRFPSLVVASSNDPFGSVAVVLLIGAVTLWRLVPSATSTRTAVSVTGRPGLCYSMAS